MHRFTLRLKLLSTVTGMAAVFVCQLFATLQENGTTRFIILGLGMVLALATTGLAAMVIIEVQKSLQSLYELLQTNTAVPMNISGQPPFTNKTGFAELAGIISAVLEKKNTVSTNPTNDLSPISTFSDDIAGTSSQIAMSITALAENSTTVAKTIRQTANKNIAISSSTQEVSASVAYVASSIEELSTSLNTVANNCREESRMAAEANSRAQIIQKLMDCLRVSAMEIDKVVLTIDDIADQTNILALNATIQAASSGEAGKGFAVVAKEVKELAHQTSMATQEIAGQIETIQKNTNNSINAIKEITQIISDIDAISIIIVNSIGKQSSSVSEIAETIVVASKAAEDAATSVTESAQDFSLITHQITGMNTSSNHLIEKFDSMKEITCKLKNFINQCSQGYH